MVDLEEIERLVALMKASGVMELAVERGDFKVSLRRSLLEEEGASRSEAEAMPVAEPHHSAARMEEEITRTFTTPVISPLVGVFHNGGMPERRTVLRRGDQVKEGQVIAAIEAMKVPNELRSPINGIISRILVEDGVGVEYGQTLFLIEPEELNS